MKYALALDWVSLGILVEFLVIEIQVFGLGTVNVIEPVTHSVVLEVLERRSLRNLWLRGKLDTYLVENCSVWAQKVELVTRMKAPVPHLTLSLHISVVTCVEKRFFYGFCQKDLKFSSEF